MLFLEIIKFIVFILIFLLGASTVILIIKSIPFRVKIRISPAYHFFKYRAAVKIETEKDVIQKKWEEIIKRAESKNEQSMRLDIVEADSLVDEVLIKHGHSGKDMGERLKSLSYYEAKYIDDLWEAHKTRNKIAHTPDLKLSVEEAEKIINIYQKVLQDWELIP